MKSAIRQAGLRILALLAASAAPATASTLTTLHTFSGGADGAYPLSSPVFGPDGNLYGTTLLGGSGCSGTGCGTIFQMTPPPKGSTVWGFNTLFMFGGGLSGEEPINLVADKTGILYGVTEYGGNTPCIVNGIKLGCGTVWMLIPPVTGTTWKFYSLYQFTGGADGKAPSFGLIIDATGNLYGTTMSGGTCATGTCGTVFELSPPTGNQTTYQLKTLHAFSGGVDGSMPLSTPLMDAAGNLYVSTTLGGYSANSVCLAAGGCGQVAKLTAPAQGKTVWSKAKAWDFSGADGIAPLGTLYVDATGNLYGMTNYGGNLNDCGAVGTTPPGCGTLFELTPPAPGATKWVRTTLWSFTAGADGLFPSAGVTPAPTGFYATTGGNGVKGYGSAVTVLPPAPGSKKWTETTQVDFKNDANGAQPAAAMTLRSGVLYGTTLGYDGPGPAQYGTVFSLVP